jgi:hypothetical protein
MIHVSHSGDMMRTMLVSCLWPSIFRCWTYPPQLFETLLGALDGSAAGPGAGSHLVVAVATVAGYQIVVGNQPGIGQFADCQLRPRSHRRRQWLLQGQALPALDRSWRKLTSIPGRIRWSTD